MSIAEIWQRTSIFLTPLLNPAALLIVIALLGGCAAFDQSANLRKVANQAGWTEHLLIQKTFTIFALQSRGAATAETMHVYVEGDGRAWVRRNIPPDNPTPRDPVALRLALADPAPGVIYLARPCQYVEGLARQNCTTDFWSTARFAPEVIADLNSTITSLLSALPTASPRRLLLFGYSGGGTVAALIAARRSDTAALVTIAAPLNHDAWTRHHQLSLLLRSLNPADKAPNAFPEIHMAGGEDKIVPPALTLAYAERRSNTSVILKPTFDHGCCWADAWSEILAELKLPQ